MPRPRGNYTFSPIAAAVPLEQGAGAVADPICNTTELEAAPERVGDLLVDFDRSDELDPSVDRADAKRPVERAGSLNGVRRGFRVIPRAGGHPLRGLLTAT